VTDEISKARRRKARNELADAVLTDMGGSAEQLSAMFDGVPDQIRQAVVESLERQQAYRSIRTRHAAQDEAEGIRPRACHNGACEAYKQSEGVREVDNGDMTYYEDFGERDFCTRGVDFAQGCMFRMVEQPPSDPFRRLPSHAEALRMLMRAGLLKPDDFGQWNGTDFAQRENTRKLWWAYVDMLVATGRISAHPFEHEGETMFDRGKQTNDALVTLGLPPHDQD